jgi:hypothetical protein
LWNFGMRLERYRKVPRRYLFSRQTTGFVECIYGFKFCPSFQKRKRKRR